MRRISRKIPTILHSLQRRLIVDSPRTFSLGLAFLVAVLVASTLLVFVHRSQPTRADFGFSFTVAGDYDQTTATTKTLQKISQLYTTNQISFHLGLGDFSYAPKPTAAQAAAWSAYAKSNLAANFPFEIVAGRHDTSQMSTYETNLPPNNIPTSTNCSTCAYGQQYYFDYPLNTTPPARFILLSPNQKIPGYTYNYNKGGADYQWVSNTIDAAHSARIPWVIVGMHQYCFVIGPSSCPNPQLLNLLLSKHVDVILQAQQHNYQRSKQLALTSSNCTAQCCPTLNAKSYNATCVANAADTLTQGAGSVIVLTGTAGATPQLAVNTSDPKTGYFKQWMDPNNVTWGLSQFTISTTQLTEHFVGTSGGTFIDSFTITNGASSPIPTPTPTSTTMVNPGPF